MINFRDVAETLSYIFIQTCYESNFEIGLCTRSKICKNIFIRSLFTFSMFRYLSTQAKLKSNDEVKATPKTQPQHNQSFVHNLFRGQVESSQVFPFPMALNEEQTEYVGAFVDPVMKFFTEVNDASRNDANAVSFHFTILCWTSNLI